MSRSSRTLPKNQGGNHQDCAYREGSHHSPNKSVFQAKRDRLLYEASKMLNYNNRIETIRQNVTFEKNLITDKGVCQETQMQIQKALKDEADINRHISTNLGVYAGHQITLQELDSSSGDEEGT